MEQIENYRKAVDRLTKGVSAFSNKPWDDLYRDGLIFRFRYTVNFAWKSVKEYLQEQGFVIHRISPKAMMKEAYANGLIKNEKVWLELLEDYMQTSHLYSEQAAKRIANSICTEYLPVLQALDRYYTGE